MVSPLWPQEGHSTGNERSELGLGVRDKQAEEGGVRCACTGVWALEGAGCVISSGLCNASGDLSLY